MKIPPIVYEMAKHDSESYVRASAYKCLTKMVSINTLWENSLSQLDLVVNNAKFTYVIEEYLITFIILFLTGSSALRAVS